MVLEAYVKAFVTREIETKAYNGKAVKWPSSLLMRLKINIGVLQFLYDYGHESSDTKVHILITRWEVELRASV